ncbi:MAG: type IV secretory system conjugative DNA transfer family protein, partial [Candidatus Cloacimonetes bacterium]|nr:type IV secretory system conjugative DNA transfer family protein [Candidatus Cloacimonadota bacterium]
MTQNLVDLGMYLEPEGSARWADEDELTAATTTKRIIISEKICEGGGIPILSDGNDIYVDDSDSHTMIFGSTGSKKTRLFGMPLINILAMRGESFIVTDPKTELFNKTSGFVRKRGYNVAVLNFRDMQHSDYWNPLALPWDLYHSGQTSEATSLINDLICSLIGPLRDNKRDHYFTELSYALMLANMMFFIDTAKREEANIYNFASFFSQNSNIPKTKVLANAVAENSIAHINYMNVLTNADAKSTFGNVSAGVAVMLRPFVVHRPLCQMLSQSSFDIRDIAKSKNAIYLVVPDEKTTLHSVVAMFVKQVYEATINAAQNNHNKQLPIRLNFVLDEFANIPAIPDMQAMITASRSRNMRFFMMLQGMMQLIQKYGLNAQTIKGNCDNIIFLSSSEHELLQEISSLSGTVLRDNGKEHPLVSISQLQHLKKEWETSEVYIRHARNYPFISVLPDYDLYRFRSYKPINLEKKVLPEIAKYDYQKILEEIDSSQRPIPFSKETCGEYVFQKTAPPRK